MRTKVVAALAASMMALSGCGDAEDDAGSEQTPATQASGPAESEPQAEGGEEPADDVERFTVQGGKRAEGPERLEVKAGETVSIEVETDAPDELHVHGYDETVSLQPGKPGKLEFTADMPGVWEIELHDSGNVLTELRVR